jgi:hypothetical protein
MASEFESRATAIDVFLGRKSPDELESMKRLKAQEQAQTTRTAQTVMRPCSDGQERAVPEHVLAAEKADGIRREFMQTRDRNGDHWQGWTTAARAKTPEEEDEEKRMRVTTRWDPVTQEYVRDEAPQMPPIIARVNSILSKDDPRRGQLVNGQWVFPRAVPIEQNPERPDPDLNSPHGYPIGGRGAMDKPGSEVK